eukprot:1181836-Prorocentrum_minimum.AAC.3
MGVLSDGSYGIPTGLMYSFPVTCKDGKWSIVQGAGRSSRGGGSGGHPRAVRPFGDVSLARAGDVQKK